MQTVEHGMLWDTDTCAVLYKQEEEAEDGVETYILYRTPNGRPCLYHRFPHPMRQHIEYLEYVDGFKTWEDAADAIATIFGIDAVRKLFDIPDA